MLYLQDLFTINYVTGMLSVAKPLNSRLTAIVSYGVEAHDIAADPVQTGPGRIVINVLPFNVQPPVFDPYDTPIYIDEEQPIGSVILSFIAQDDNGIRMYKIYEQPDDNFVAINPNTGTFIIFLYFRIILFMCKVSCAVVSLSCIVFGNF